MKNLLTLTASLAKENEAHSLSAGNNRVFTQVSYREFRDQITGIATKDIKSKGYETTIFDADGNIHAIMHAASIDNHGNCYPAEYFIRTDVLLPQWYQAA